MNNYKQVSLYERELISIGIEKGFSYRSIAQQLRRYHTTIAREIKRNRLYAPKPSLITQPYIVYLPPYQVPVFVKTKLTLNIYCL